MYPPSIRPHAAPYPINHYTGYHNVPVTASVICETQLAHSELFAKLVTFHLVRKLRSLDRSCPAKRIIQISLSYTRKLAIRINIHEWIFCIICTVMSRKKQQESAVPHCTRGPPQLTARYWLLVAVLTVQFVPHRKHTPSP
jgi:hypothetical protein